MKKSPKLRSKTLVAACDLAARAIPPVWPLASSVAVNPFLGQTGETLADVGARLGRISGTAVTMPRAWYDAKLTDGTITDTDLEDAIAASGVEGMTPETLRDAAKAEANPAPVLPMVSHLAAEVSGIDWPGILKERFGVWAAGYFDEGQALWAAPRGRGAYSAWREVATHDLTPEITGLKGFAQFVNDAPETAEAATARSAARLGLSEAMLETYFHQALLDFGGWSQVARYKLWEAELAGSDDATITDFLAIRLIWEEALLTQYEAEIESLWAATRAGHARPLQPCESIVIDALLQEAAERATQRDLAETFAAPLAEAKVSRPALQAAFCIDVRSEVFRRALEATSPKIQTLGFAGFFGLTAAHRGFASDVVEKRLPVLLNPGITSVSGDVSVAEADQTARFQARAKRAWGRFKLAAVSSFAFVEATGPIYAGKLVKDALNMSPNSPPNDPAPRLDPALDLETRTVAANTVLRAMSLTQNFARLIVIAGHGANVVNNPHASGLHCGACGGYSGEVNARLLAGLLNERDVREGLVAHGIDIPADTHFVGALHDTTTDTVTLYKDDYAHAPHAKDIAHAVAWFEQAGKATRAERSLRLPRAASDEDIALRARDWAETRPEWALAGCKAFVAAPRGRTAGKSLEGRAFLHDYDWKQDTSFGVLELIMTAPVVVASWISLQYYGSTVAPALFGSGNKLLHNVTGGIGVVEGNGGIMRAGLPLQSVHDGERYVHEPVRLSVCIEAPREAMTDILRRHDGVRALFDNRWLYLFALDDAGRMAWRYEGNLEWSEVPVPTSAEPVLDIAG